MFTRIEEILIASADLMPLEIFAFLSSFIEEVIAPIPSPAAMIATGSLASLQGRPFYNLFILCLLGAAGKLLGAIIVYFIADKVEDIFSGKLAKFFGVSHEDVESFGARLGKGWKQYLGLTFLRALPIMPSSLVSIGSGIIKVRWRVYIVSTFFGTIIRDFFYIYFGYAGITALGSILNKSATVESIIQTFAVVAIAALLGYAYYQRRKQIKTIQR